MKKLLIFLSLMVISGQAYANTISVQPFISNNDVSITHLENQRSTFQTVINGNIEGGAQNIKQGSITSYDLATAINPVQRWKESFNNFTYNGMLAPTSGTLSSTTTAGVSYINGVRVETAATAHTYTASKDTYVYINAGGFFDYSEVANGASAPSTPANDLLLFKAVTNGTTITSVSDLRTTSIQITVNSSNFSSDYRDQAQAVRDSTTAMHLEPGQIAIGTTNYTNTADTSSRSTGTSSNWIEGGVPNQNNLKFYVYAYNNAGSAYDFKYSSADPVYSDTSSNTSGTLQYYTSGGTTYRAIGWVSGDSTGLIQNFNYSQYVSSGTRNVATSETGAVATGTVLIPWDDTIPQSNEGDQYMSVTFKPNNANSILKITVVAMYSDSVTNSEVVTALFQDSTASALAAVANRIPTNAAGEAQTAVLTHYMLAGSTSFTTFKVRIGADQAGTITFNGAGGARKLGGVMASSISVEELPS